MKKLLILLVCFFVVGFVGPMFFPFSDDASSGKIVVEDITVEPMNYADGEYTWLTVNCTVQNNAEKSGMVSVVIGTVDQWAFSRKSFSLSGFAKAGEKATLSVLDFMDSTMFKTIKRYEVKSVDLH